MTQNFTKYAHKYANKNVETCKKYVLNMQKYAQKFSYITGSYDIILIKKHIGNKIYFVLHAITI